MLVFSVLVILIIEDPTVTVKCRGTIQERFVYFDLVIQRGLGSL